MIDRLKAGIKLFLAASTMGMVSQSQADIITDWNAKAVAIMAAERVVVGVPPARTLTIMHIAMFDAANASEGRYLPYRTAMPEARGASVEAAVHAAARRVLVELFPKQKGLADAHFDAGMAGLLQGQPTTAGIAAGEKAAAAILNERKSDGFFGPDEYRPITEPGVYTGTAPLVMSHVQLAKPFGLRTVSDFRPGPPPALKSAQWARDYNETKELGGVNSTKRTAWQAETGRFWAVSGVIAWNEAARGLSASKPLPLIESARMFALLNISIVDALLAVFDAKYHYKFWRPVTAIRNGDIDGNDATAREAGWTPLISTPLHPEYPCAHCVIDGSGGVILKAAFGSSTVPEFTLTYDAMPGVTRKYTTIQQLEDEVAMARIWGGVHYRSSNEAGNALGQRVARHIAEHYLRPAH